MDENNTVHFGTGESESWWRRFARRSVLIPAFAILFVAIGAWVVFNLKDTTEKKQGALDTAIKASDASFTTGDYQKSLDTLKDASDDAQSKAEKVELYNSLAAAALNAGKTEEAIDYMKKKHELDPESAKADAYLIGSYYEQTGKNEDAIKQYKIAIEYKESQPKNSRRDADIESLKARIESLGGQ